MRTHCLLTFSLLIVTHASPLTGSVQARNQAQVNQSESETRPEPLWVSYVDQGGSDPRLRGYRSADGLKVEVIAEGPVVVNPIAMTFADDGTPFVIEWRTDKDENWQEHTEIFTYRDGSTRRARTIRKRIKDVVKTLHDTDGDGKYDRAEVVLEEELPSGILLHEGWIYVSGQGTVRRYRQSKPGGPYDRKEVIAQGFSSFHLHQVSGLTVGNDGWLYITAGDGDNRVEGSDGSRATVLRSGAVFRCRPDGSRMDVFAVGFRNPLGNVAFDGLGNMFQADHGYPDGGKWTGTRLLHVGEGDDFGWRRSPGVPCGPPDHRLDTLIGELPGKSPHLLRTGRGFSTGLFVYKDAVLPFEFRGLLYYPDALRRRIRAYTPAMSGGGFELVEQFDFLRSDDPLFRPRQMITGPDGAIYILDQRTSLRGVLNPGREGGDGRLYRVSWSGTKELPAIKTRPSSSWGELLKASDEDLLKHIVSVDESLRLIARKQLIQRGEKNRKSLLALLDEVDTLDEGKIAVLGVLLSMWDEEVQEACQRLVQNGEFSLRRYAAQVLSLHARKEDKNAHNVLLVQLGDENPAVRRAVALAMGRIGSPGAAEALVNALAFNESKDADLERGLIRAIENLGKPGIDRLLALFESGVKKDADRVVDAFLTMRTRPAAEAIPRVLKYPHLTIEQRAGLVRSHANYLLDPPLPLDPLLDYLVSQPGEAEQVQLAGVAVLSLEGFRSGEKSGEWLLSLLEKESAELRIAALGAIGRTRPNLAAPRLVKLLAEDARPSKERQAILQALRRLGDGAGVDVVEAILTRDGNSDTNLLIEGLRTLEVLAPEQADVVARKYTKHENHLVRKEAISILGTTHEGARVLGAMIKGGSVTVDLLPVLSGALGKWTAKDETLAEIHRELLQAKLPLKTDSNEIARLSKLVETTGDPVRGRAIYTQGKKLACAQCHRLEVTGQSFGPDLTRLWQTHSASDILLSLLDPDGNPSIDGRAQTIITKAGRKYLGLVIAETSEEVLLRDAGGRDIFLNRKDIEARRKGSTSLMSKQTVAALTEEELVHLVAFLADRKAQESLRSPGKE